MIQITPQLRIFVAVEPADFRQGIDGLAALCRRRLEQEPFSGAIFVFRNRRRTGIKLLAFDGQGFWLCYKRLSEGKFKYWPTTRGQPSRELRAHELQVLLTAGDPSTTRAAPEWRSVRPPLEE